MQCSSGPNTTFEIGISTFTSMSRSSQQNFKVNSKLIIVLRQTHQRCFSSCPVDTAWDTVCLQGSNIPANRVRSPCKLDGYWPVPDFVPHPGSNDQPHSNHWERWDPSPGSTDLLCSQYIRCWLAAPSYCWRCRGDKVLGRWQLDNSDLNRNTTIENMHIQETHIASSLV